jgi:hypothetical protein
MTCSPDGLAKGAGDYKRRQSKTILARSCEAGGAEQSGLLTHIATTESVSLCIHQRTLKEAMS